MKVRGRTTGVRGKTRYSSRLTSKYQATVPKAVRQQLHLESGDQIVYELLQDGTVVVSKSTPLDVDYLAALNTTLSEWNSDEDDSAYQDL